MNEAIENAPPRRTPWTPSLSFYHPSQRGNGAAVRFEIVPASGDRDGLVYLSIAPQDPSPASVVTTPAGKRCASFLWKSRICVKLTFVEVAEALLVLSGAMPALNHGGKGGFFHSSADANTTVDLRRSDDPDRPGGVFLAIARTPKGGAEGRQSACFNFQSGEAYGLRLALEQSMSLLAFGLTDSGSAYALRRSPGRGAARPGPLSGRPGAAEEEAVEEVEGEWQP